MTKIFTDTSGNLPDELIRRHEITVIPFHYSIDGREFSALPDNGVFDGKAFYDEMRSGVAVQTSMINEHDFRKAFEEALAQGDDVVYVGMSGNISGTYQASLTAAAALCEQYPDRRIATVNTRGASLGEGFAALYAAQLAKAETGFDELVEKVEASCNAMCQYFTVETLTYLQRGGRISKVLALVGNLLSIKPVLRGDMDGNIVLYHKTRGRQKSLDALVEKYGEFVTDRSALVGIAHADCAEDAAKLERQLRENGHTGKVLTVCYEPVTGSHVGPGALALFFYGKRT